jgi:hypothetical protein
LNDLVGQLKDDGIDLGLPPFTSTTDTLLLDSGSRLSFKYVLAVHLCPFFERPITPDLATLADQGNQRLLRRAINEKLQPVDMTHLPMGTAVTYNILTDS